MIGMSVIEETDWAVEGSGMSVSDRAELAASKIGWMMEVRLFPALYFFPSFLDIINSYV